ncbi:MAG: hypothetical protein IJ194_05715, partial [Bacilli bacterium]|nr:hypothetical protein [Bacilli bacterium]
GLGFASPFFPRLGRPSKVGFGYVGFLYKATHRGLSPQACDVPVTQKAPSTRKELFLRIDLLR